MLELEGGEDGGHLDQEDEGHQHCVEDQASSNNVIVMMIGNDDSVMTLSDPSVTDLVEGQCKSEGSGLL